MADCRQVDQRFIKVAKLYACGCGVPHIISFGMGGSLDATSIKLLSPDVDDQYRGDKQ
jgi:hypothetical protein